MNCVKTSSGPQAVYEAYLACPWAVGRGPAHLSGTLVTKDTEQDLVLAPSQYWSLYLQPKLEEVLRKKLPPNRQVKVVDTNVVVLVKERLEQDLTKRFDKAEIDWPVVEKQLIAWGELFHAGKKLMVDLSLNYVDID